MARQKAPDPLVGGRSIESVQVHLSRNSSDSGTGRAGLIIDPLRDANYELMAVLSVKYLEAIADHWPSAEPLDRRRQQELYDAASLLNVLLLELRRRSTND